jgi:hypothetical protein
VIAKAAASGLDARLVAAIAAAYLGLVVLILIGWVKILSNAGYSGWWALIGFVPLVNFIMLLVFAFSDWPVLREVRSLRSAARIGFSTGPTEGPLARRHSGPPATTPPHKP